MPVDALSLFGFMPEIEGMNYLASNSLLEDRTESALRAEWETARAKLGPSIDGAGQPEVRDLEPEHATYLKALEPQIAPFAPMRPSFRLVEIDPLLAYQFHVELPRAETLTATPDIPTTTDALAVCLPHALEAIPYRWVPQNNGVLIQSRSLNLRLAGTLDPRAGTAGISFAASSPLVQVACFDGRCYLRNGFHRTYGLRQRGLTHLPCLFLEPTDFAQVGARGEGATFDRALLESDDPPTLAHFTRGSAHRLPLRVFHRMIQVTWSEYVLPEPD